MLVVYVCRQPVRVFLDARRSPVHCIRARVVCLLNTATSDVCE